ncbi:hypothetical protein SAMN04487976_101111 [Xaviernesmea oryzae]|nr:hypothetical protein SAMN04487976_101111 [Xaviernesmea oryzae]
MRAAVRPADDALEGLLRLKKAWMKASEPERMLFLGWLQENSQEAAALSPGIAHGRYLTPDAIDEIRARMMRRGWTAGDVMAHIGFSPEDPALENALARGAALRLVVVAALTHWLANG